MEEFMNAAIEEATIGLQEGGIPIGSVLVREGKIIGRGHNRRVQNGDPLAHAEIGKAGLELSVSVPVRFQSAFSVEQSVSFNAASSLSDI